MDDLPRLTTSAFIGIMVAITGNVLISLALNLQKLAHKRGKARKLAAGQTTNGNTNHRDSGRPSLDENDEDQDQTRDERNNEPTSNSSTTSSLVNPSENQPLVPFPQSSPQPRDYGSVLEDASSLMPTETPVKPKRNLISRFISPRIRSKGREEFAGPRVHASLVPIDIVSEDAALHGIFRRRKEPEVDSNNDDDEENEGAYLKSKLWWFGFLLMNLGELGNFISYAYAPASVVAPLGTFALMANCIFAPLLLGERFRKRDLFGIFIAIIGATTVVLSTNASDTRLNPEALIRAISQIPFIVYTCIYVAGAIILSTLSRGNIGKTWVFVDVGLCAIFGGFTVLSTKAFSTLLTVQWIEIFTMWITYPVLAVLFLTGVGQIRYLNRALMRFDSKIVIPVQFVLFTLSAIVGSAILYGDFKKAKFHQVITFLYGCAATFAGVFIIAWAPNQTDENEGFDDNEIAADEETLRLGTGVVGRRQRPTLVLPSKDSPLLHHRRSAVSLIGISPAQHLLLVHTPPREVPPRIRDDSNDMERGSIPSELHGRRRAMSWLGSDGHGRRSSTGTRDNSIAARLGHVTPNSVGFVGSFDNSQIHR